MVLHTKKSSRYSTAFLCAFICLLPEAGDLLAVTGNVQSVIVKGEKPKLVFDDGFYLEGPAMGPDGYLYFCDITVPAQTGMQAGYIWKFDVESQKASIFRSPSGMASGIIFDSQGRMLVAQGADFGSRSIIRTDMKSGRSEILAGLFNDRPFNSPNDLTVDEAGRIYFTDPRYGGHEAIEQPVMGVYCIDPDGSITLIIDDIGMPNGILVSPDQKTLYVSCVELPLWSGLNAVLAYDLDSEGNVSNRRILVDFRPNIGPDGMAIDIEGNLYLARPDNSEPGVHIYSPKGEFLELVEVPGPPSNVAFGKGKYSKTLFITAGNSLYQINTNIAGYHAQPK